MPIYAYRCEACGFAKDVLQSMSAAPLTDCESCGKPEFRKQVTAAGFQLKGSGWYVTDFRNGAAPAAKSGDGAAEAPAAAGTTATATAAATPAASATSAPAAANTSTTATTTPTPAAS
jgi:putative FmdB family regulatory protein